LLSLFSFVKK
jgi:hypothetical protein